MPEISKKIAGSVEIPLEVLKEIQKEIKNISSFKKEVETSLEKRVTEVLEIILGGAIFLDASDIHIEPTEEKAKIRIE